MIAIWNQREVFLGYSLENFIEARNLLAANGVAYKYRIVDKMTPQSFSSRRASIWTFGEKIECSTMYYIYVHKKDYESACALLNRKAF